MALQSLLTFLAAGAVAARTAQTGGGQPQHGRRQNARWRCDEPAADGASRVKQKES